MPLYLNYKKIISILSFFLLITSFVLAEERAVYLSLKNSEVNVRQGPSFDYPIKFIYKKKFLPVKIIDNSDNFKKIIDIKKNSGWIHRSQLSTKNSAINIKEKSILFNKPKIYSKPIAKIEVGKLFIIKKCKLDWCKVSDNKLSGWIKKEYLWGRF